MVRLMTGSRRKKNTVAALASYLENISAASIGADELDHRCQYKQATCCMHAIELIIFGSATLNLEDSVVMHVHQYTPSKTILCYLQYTQHSLVQCQLNSTHKGGQTLHTFCNVCSSLAVLALCYKHTSKIVCANTNEHNQPCLTTHHCTLLTYSL